MAVTALSGQRWQGSTDTGGYKSATFDGSNDSAESAGSLGITTGTSYSFGAWCYVQAQSGALGMICALGGKGFLYRTGTGADATWKTEGNGANITSSSGVTDNEWHHFMVNVVSSTATLYIDGADAQASPVSDTISGSATVDIIDIGYEKAATAYYLKGSVQDFFFFTRSLTAPEIASLSGGAKVSSISQTDLEANYTFNSDFTDRSGNSINLTASGATAGNSVGTSPTLVDDKLTVTDVPVGSQFEETNTRKFYQFDGTDWIERGTAI